MRTISKRHRFRAEIPLVPFKRADKIKTKNISIQGGNQQCQSGESKIRKRQIISISRGRGLGRGEWENEAICYVQKFCRETEIYRYEIKSYQATVRISLKLGITNLDESQRKSFGDTIQKRSGTEYPEFQTSIFVWHNKVNAVSKESEILCSLFLFLKFYI